MRARKLAENYPVVDLDSDALEAARLLASRRLPGLVVTDATGKPYAILPASQVVRFLVPTYVQDDPSLAAVVDEPLADRVASKLVGHRVCSLLPKKATELPVVDAEDTILEVAAVMARLRYPLVVVVDNDTVVGVVTASRLLEQALSVC